MMPMLEMRYCCTGSSRCLMAPFQLIVGLNYVFDSAALKITFVIILLWIGYSHACSRFDIKLMSR
ncbi:hypothetical protein DsansV1_C03g0030801 [Dioscorea sansibarensis]